jgi:hypothetical protein
MTGESFEARVLAGGGPGDLSDRLYEIDSPWVLPERERFPLRAERAR